MGRNRGTGKEPPVMDGSPKKEPYKRPANSVLDMDVFSPMTLHPPGEIGEYEHRLHIVQWRYRKKIVDFRLMHTMIVSGDDVDVARIDCCNGSIHRHAFDKSGNDLLDHLVVEQLWQGGDTWEKVHDLYDPCWDMLVEQVEDNYRRWLQ